MLLQLHRFTASVTPPTHPPPSCWAQPQSMNASNDATGPPAQQPVTTWHNSAAAHAPGGPGGNMPSLPLPGVTLPAGLSGMFPGGTDANPAHHEEAE